MSTRNICFCWEIRKIIFRHVLLPGGLVVGKEDLLRIDEHDTQLSKVRMLIQALSYKYLLTGKFLPELQSHEMIYPDYIAFILPFQNNG